MIINTNKSTNASKDMIYFISSFAFYHKQKEINNANDINEMKRNVYVKTKKRFTIF